MSYDPRFIFISYKREELDHATTIKEALEQDGYAVWWDADIQCGKVWSEVLDDAIKKANCVIVLWSNQSMNSAWVRHEASCAIARDVYTPLRSELVNIEPPYDRIQAIDLISGEFSTDHPGYLALRTRVDDLLPEKLSATHRFIRSIWRARLSILAIGFAIAALLILAYQTFSSINQTEQMASLLKQQENVARDIERAVHPIEDLEVEIGLEVRSGIKDVDLYLQRLDHEAAALIQGKDPLHWPNNIYIVSEESFPENKIELLGFKPGSILAPDFRTERSVANALNVSVYTLAFYAGEIVPNAFTDTGSEAPDPALKILVYTAQEYLWSTTTKTLTMRLRMASDKGLWTRTDEIVSIPDLKRSWFILKLSGNLKSSSMRASDSASKISLFDLVRIKTLMLTMSDGRRFHLDESYFDKFPSKDHVGLYFMNPKQWQKAEKNL